MNVQYRHFRIQRAIAYWPETLGSLTQSYHVDALGWWLARRYAGRITLDFFGHQLVCQLGADAIDLELRMHPRH